MLYIAESTKGLAPNTTVYSVFSHDWQKVYDLELTAVEYRKLRAKKKVFEEANWMKVLANTDEDKRTGQYAQEVNSIKELLNG